MRLAPVVFAALVACGPEEEECSEWYCEDGATGAQTDGDATGKGTGKGTEKGETGDKDGAITVAWELDIATGMGTLWTRGADCETTYALQEPSVREDCSDCAVAYELGGVATGGDAAPCDGKDTFDAVPVGHVDPGSLYYFKDGWTDITAFGSSQLTAGVWAGEYSF